MRALTLRRMWFRRILWLESVPDVSTPRTEGTVGLDTLVGDESGGRVTPWTLDVGSRRRRGKQPHGASLPDLRRRSLFKSEQPLPLVRFDSARSNTAGDAAVLLCTDLRCGRCHRELMDRDRDVSQ